MPVHNGLALKSANGFDSEVGILVKKATEAEGALSGPNWELIINICDLCRATISNCENAVVSLVWRIKEPSEDVILLTMSLIDLCLKNCENTFPSCMNKVLMDEIIYIAVGGAGKGKIAEQFAQKLITEWGMKYEMKFKLPIFHDTYTNLVSKGMLSPTVVKQPVATTMSPPRTSPAPVLLTVSGDCSLLASAPVVDISHYDEISELASHNHNYLLQLERDLEVVIDKINLSKSIRKGLLTHSPRRDNADSHEIAMDILDFLCSCRQRLMEIIDSGTAGLLSSTCVHRCIAINEELSTEIDQYEVCEEIEIADAVEAVSLGSFVAGVSDKQTMKPLQSEGSCSIQFPSFPNTTTDIGALSDSSAVVMGHETCPNCLDSNF